MDITAEKKLALNQSVCTLSLIVWFLVDFINFTISTMHSSVIITRAMPFT